MSIGTITEFYQLGLWNQGQIAQLVKGGVITVEQYAEIVGSPYKETETVVNG